MRSVRLYSSRFDVRGAMLGAVLAASSMFALPVVAETAPAPSDSAEAPAAATSFRTAEAVVACPGAAEALDLADCVEAALARNEALQAERIRLGEVSGKKYQALATGLPTLDASAEWSRGRDPSFALDESFAGDDGLVLPSPLDTLLGGFSFLPSPEDIPAQTFWRTSLNLNWIINPIKFFGTLGAANLGIRQQDLAVLELEHRTAEQVVTAYHAIILASEQLAAVSADIANREEILATMRMRHDLGLATTLDTLRAAVALANAVPERRRARAALRIAGANLNALMGQDAGHPLSIRNEQRIELEPVRSERALELAWQRPDLMQVDIYTELLRQSRKAQKAEMRPYLSVDGQFGYVARRFGELDEKGHDFWRTTIALNLPLFDGLLTKGLVKETDATIRRTEAELAGQKRQVRVEVLQILADLDAARRTLRSADLNLQQAEDIMAEMSLMLRLGTTDYLSVLEAEASRSLARSNLIRARFDVLTLTAALKRAVGVSPLLPLYAIEGLTADATE